MALELEQRTAKKGSLEIEKGTLVVAVSHECIETKNEESSEVVEDEVEEESRTLERYQGCKGSLQLGRLLLLSPFRTWADGLQHLNFFLKEVSSDPFHLRSGTSALTSPLPPSCSMPLQGTTRVRSRSLEERRLTRTSFSPASATCSSGQ